jgi:uncharacterized membrane protein
MGSLIPSENSLAVAAGLFGIVFIGLLAEKTELGRKMSAPLIALAGGMLLSNIRLLPFESPAYGFVVAYLVPLAIPLLLLNADLKRIFRETGPTLIAFLAGALGTTVGAAVGFLVIDAGPETHKAVGVLAATYIGGSFNFVAVAQALQIEDPELLAAAATAQGVAAIPYLGLLILAPSIGLLARWFGPADDGGSRAVAGATTQAAPNAEDEASSSGDVAACITFSLVLCAVSLGLAELLGISQFGILVITVFTVAVASLAPGFMKRLAGGDRIGLLLVYVFIAAVGAQSNVWELAGMAAILVGFLGIVLFFHAIFVLAAGHIFRLTLPEVITGSNACAFGASTAAAVAAGRRWHSLVTPGILCGILGYVIANFIGVALATVLAGA